MKHGVYVTQTPTSVSTPVVAPSGVPFVIGTAPVQSAQSPVLAGQPVLCTSWDEAVEQLGYSDDWENYTLCEMMYSHFKLFGCQPVIFCNLLDPATMTAATNAEVVVVDHTVTLPLEAICNQSLLVAASDDTQNTYVCDTDYALYYSDQGLHIALLEDGACYAATTLQITYDAITPAAVDANTIAAGLESIELCANLLGQVPDLICAPGYSHNATVAAVMATKASGINGMFKAKALIDLDCTSATHYTAAITQKGERNMVDATQIVCWPMVKLDTRTFHLSTQLAGLMAQVDAANDCPYESPSNKTLSCDGLVLQDGTEVQLTHAQANVLGASGIVTALRFMNGWTAWGNYTACYPASTDVKDYMISVSRMFDWVGNTLIRTFWSKIDQPMNRRLIDNIIDSSNIWLNGLVGMERLYGARVALLDAENPLTDLMAGIIRVHVYMTPPSPAQEIDFVQEYDVSYVQSAVL